MHCLGSGGIQQTWQNLAETVDCGRIWQKRQIAANCGGTCGRLRWIAVDCGGTCGRLWWRQVESRWRVCKVSRRCPVTSTVKTIELNLVSGLCLFTLNKIHLGSPCIAIELKVSISSFRSLKLPFPRKGK